MSWYSTILASSPAVEFASLDHKRILIIEDDLGLQAELVRLMKSMFPQNEVDWATTADEVIRDMDHNPVALDSLYEFVLSDVLLPGHKSGVEFWKICRRRFPKTSVLLMSGMDQDSFRRMVGSTRDAPPLLMKPFSLKDCRRAIQSVMPSETQRAA